MADRSPVWAAAGIMAGGLVAVSPWLGGVAALACLGTAVWRSRRPEPVPGAPTAGDLAAPWPDKALDGLRLDLISVWTRVHAGGRGLNVAMNRLEARLEAWSRLLGDSGANIETLSRVTHAVRGDLDTAVQAISRELRRLAEWQAAWAEARQALQRAATLHATQAHDLQRWEAVWRQAEEQRLTLNRAADGVFLPDTAGVPSLLRDARALSVQAAALADEAGRLGKSGWAVALAAVQAQEAMVGWVKRAEGVLMPWEDAVQSVAGLLDRIADTPAPTVPAPAGDPAPWSDPGDWPMPDLMPTIDRLDRACRDSELSVGLADDVATQLVSLQRQTERLAVAMADARHQASELLILSGYVRTQAVTPACHLNRTAWCITDGDCERCPLTKLDEAEFPGLLGPSAPRPQPRIGRTGRTIDLEGRGA